MMKDDDFKLLRGFGDEQTFVVVESLLRLKTVTRVKMVSFALPPSPLLKE